MLTKAPEPSITALLILLCEVLVLLIYQAFLSPPPPPPPNQSGFQCPTCKKVYGIKTGNMPDGTMTVRKQRYTLPGHDGHGSIEITYNFTAGVHVSVTFDSHIVLLHVARGRRSSYMWQD